MKKKVTGGGHDFRRSLFDGPNLVEEVGDMAIVRRAFHRRPHGQCEDQFNVSELKVGVTEL
jgi:hypothetical protein